MNINHLFLCLAFLGESIFGDRKEWQCGQETDKAAVDSLVRQNSANNLLLQSISPTKSPIMTLDADALAAIEAQAYTAQRKEAMLDA